MRPGWSRKARSEWGRCPRHHRRSAGRSKVRDRAPQSAGDHHLDMRRGSDLSPPPSSFGAGAPQGQRRWSFALEALWPLAIDQLKNGGSRQRDREAQHTDELRDSGSALTPSIRSAAASLHGCPAANMAGPDQPRPGCSGSPACCPDGRSCRTARPPGWSGGRRR